MEKDKLNDELDRIVVTNSPVFLYGSSVNITFQTNIKRYDQSYIYLKNNVPPEFITKFVGSTAFNLNINMTALTADSVNSDGEQMIFPIQDLKNLQETRLEKRLTFRNDENVYCQFINPFDKMTVLKKSVMDLSEGGFSFRSTIESKIHQPQMMLENVEIFLNGQIHKKKNATVVYKKKYMDLEKKVHLQVGFKFTN